MSDIRLAAEALQSLRASSSPINPHPPSSGLINHSEPIATDSNHSRDSSFYSSTDEPAINHIQTVADSSDYLSRPPRSQSDTYNHQEPTNLTIDTHIHHRGSLYKPTTTYQDSVLQGNSSNQTLISKSSAFQSSPHVDHVLTNGTSSVADSNLIRPTDSQVSTDSDSSIQPPISKKRKRSIKPGFLNPIVVSAAKIYQHGKSYSPRFRHSAEKLGSAISSRMANYKQLPPINEPIPGEYRPRDQEPTNPAFSSTTSATVLPPISSIHTQSSLISKPAKRRKPTWRGVLVTASSIATSLSHENKQRLRYCLHLLKLANTHIAAKVSQLQELVQEERAVAMAQSIAANHVPNTGNDKTRNNFLGQKANNIKRDIVWTIRKVISALSTYAGNSLPEPARSHVRNYILRFPARWASSLAPSNSVSGTSTGYSTPLPGPVSTATTVASNTPTIEQNILSPTSSSPINNSSVGESKQSVDSLTELQKEDTSANRSNSPSPALTLNEGEASESSSTKFQGFKHTDAEIANRVLTLANEALDMLGSIISIVDETLEKAEVWCDRFGKVGININNSKNEPQEDQESIQISKESNTKPSSET